MATAGNTKSEKTATLIQAEHEKFLKAGGKVDPAAVAKAKQALIAAEVDYEKALKDAEKLLDKARKKRHEAAAAMIAAAGSKVRVDLGPEYGVRVPSSRGEYLFYRIVGKVEEPETL